MLYNNSMSRPSRNQDKKMLDVGKQLFRKKGFSGLTIMEVCHQAGVNQGMFVYYFKNKDNFSRIVFAEVYKEFFDELKAPESIGTPLDQLRQAIKTIAKYVARNKDLFKSIMRDVLSGEKEVQNIIKKHACGNGKSKKLRRNTKENISKVKGSETTTAPFLSPNRKAVTC